MRFNEFCRSNHKTLQSNQLKNLASTTSHSSEIRKCPNLKLGDLGTILYAIIVVTLHSISLLLTMKHIKALMFSLMLDLSTNITNNLAQQFSVEQVKLRLSDSRFFITNQFWLSITMLVLSSVFMILFLVSSIFKTGNLANDNNQIGNDLTIIEKTEDRKIRYKSSSSSELTSLNFSLPTTSSPLETSSSSSSEYSSSSSFNSLKHESGQLKYKIKTLIRVFFLPPFNSSFHLIMCFFLLIAKLDLAKFQLGYDISKSTSSVLVNSNDKMLKNLFGLSNFTDSEELKSFIKLNQIFTKTLGSYVLDITHLNCLIAFLALSFKVTRVYSCMNRFYAMLIAIHMGLFTILNITTYTAFETLFKTNSLKSLSVRIMESNLKGLISIGNSRNDSNQILPKETSIVSMESDKVVLGVYLAGWTMNLIYLSTLNLFGFSFYKHAQLKLKHKYENFLAQYITSNRNGFKSAIKNPHMPHFKPEIQPEYSPIMSKIGVKNQYRSILIGIVLLLATELLRIPLVYSFYIKYFRTNVEVFLFALVGQIAYLIFNALFWIFLSFKTQWVVRFTGSFRVLYWNRLFTEHFYSQHLKRDTQPNMKTINGSSSYKTKPNRSRSVDRFFKPNALRKNSKLFIKNQRESINNLKPERARKSGESYYLSEITKLPNYHNMTCYDPRFFDYSVESMIRSQHHSKPSEPKHYDVKKPMSQIPEQNFYDNHIADVSDLNAEINSDEFEIKVKLDNPTNLAQSSLSSFNKNTVICHTTIPDFEVTDSGRESWAPLKNEFSFDKRKLFYTMIEAKANSNNNKSNCTNPNHQC